MEKKEGAEKEGQRKKREGKLVAIKRIVQKFISVQESGRAEREVMYLF
jgi:hypothetical protein